MPRKSEPAHIGARRHGQEGTFALLIPLWKCCEVFCALVVTAKRSVDKLFMHYFYNVSSASGGFAETSTGALSLTPLGDFCPQTPNLPTSGKNPAGAHASSVFTLRHMHYRASSSRRRRIVIGCMTERRGGGHQSWPPKNKLKETDKLKRGLKRIHTLHVTHSCEYLKNWTTQWLVLAGITTWHLRLDLVLCAAVANLAFARLIGKVKVNVDLYSTSSWTHL